MKKGDLIEGVVEYTTFPDKGYVFAEGKKISVKGVLPGQEIRFRLKRNGAEKAEGELKEVLKKSPDETACPACTNFGLCGGCSLQTLPYGKQLERKEDHIRKLLAPVIRSEVCRFLPIQGSPKAYEYRNKMEFSFGDAYKDGPMMLGLHKKNSMYDIVSAEDCALVHKDVRKIVSAVLVWARATGLPFYHRMGGTGFFRHLLVRRAEKTGKILADIVSTTQVECDFAELVSSLLGLALEGEIVGILHTRNDSVADVIRDDGTEVLYGGEYFTEELLGLEFRISPFSFFQTNSLGAEVLYKTARDFVGETEGKVIFDLYSGTGTIGQILAPVAKKVIGIEIIEEAVVAARENAVRNGLTNCTFLAGDVLKMLDEVTDRPDIIVLDPPRDGIHPKALTKIIDYGVDNLVYISCKPTSLARDLVPLQDAGYEVRLVQPVDMFPQTAHVETVCLLSKLHEAKHHINVKVDMDELDLTSAEAKATYKENEKWHCGDTDWEKQVFQPLIEGKPEYPVKCPACNKASCHVYINRYEETSRGGVWVWCSNCHLFSHGSTISVPDWWVNSSRVDVEKLCAADPEELVQYESELDDLVNRRMLNYCVIENACHYCRHKEYAEPHTSECPECGEKTLTSRLSGPCMIVSCSNCGYEVVGSSFFPPCHTDELTYTVMARNVEKDKRPKVAGLFGLNVMTFVNRINEYGEVTQTARLFDAEKLYLTLKELGVEVEISPDFRRKFPDLIGCKLF